MAVGAAVGVRVGVAVAVGVGASVDVTDAALAPGCVLGLLASADTHTPVPTRSSVTTPSPIQNERR